VASCRCFVLHYRSRLINVRSMILKKKGPKTLIKSYAYYLTPSFCAWVLHSKDMFMDGIRKHNW
jgi:hypothetical protein